VAFAPGVKPEFISVPVDFQPGNAPGIGIDIFSCTGKLVERCKALCLMKEQDQEECEGKQDFFHFLQVIGWGSIFEI